MKATTFAANPKKRERYISALLVLHGIRQTELAEKIGVSRPFLSQVITGKRGGAKRKGLLTEKIRRGVADALGMTVAELWPEQTARGE